MYGMFAYISRRNQLNVGITFHLTKIIYHTSSMGIKFISYMDGGMGCNSPSKTFFGFILFGSSISRKPASVIPPTPRYAVNLLTHAAGLLGKSSAP